MSVEDRLSGLLDEWQEHYAQGRDVPAVDLCAGCPELTSELARRMDAVRRMNRLLVPAADDEAGGAQFIGSVRKAMTQPWQADPALGNGDTPAGLVGGGRSPAGDKGSLRRLGGYQLLELLGQGGMGEVYLAVDSVLARRVAVKVMKPEIAARPEFRERFLREARSAAALQHDHVVPIYHVGEDAGVPFIAMPLLRGETIEDRVRREGQLPVAEVLRIGREAAAGLAAAHTAGLVHRDIKPANLWLEVPGGRVKVLDFGLARAIQTDGLTQSGLLIGTPEYMSPEQGDGRPVDSRSDLFSLGCVLYRVATGNIPFQGRTLMTLLRAVADHHPPPPREARPELPVALSNLIERLLAKDPDQRAASAREVVETLRAIEQSPPGSTIVGPEHAAAPKAAASRCYRNRWAITAAGIAAFAVTVAALRPWSREGSGLGVVVTPAVVEALRVVSLHVHHSARVDAESARPQGILGQQSFGAAVGDRVTVEAKLSRPAYAYLLAFRPDGVVELCFPESEDEPPPLTDRPRYPSRDRGKEYGLDEGAGLWLFAVAVSDKPLPPYRDWIAGKVAPWRKESAPVGVVWIDDGQWVEAVSQAGVNRGDRAKGAETPGRSAVVRVADWLRDTLPARAVEVVGVAVTERK